MNNQMKTPGKSHRRISDLQTENKSKLLITTLNMESYRSMHKTIIENICRNRKYLIDDEHEADFPPLTNDQKKLQIPDKKWLTEGGYRLAHKPKNNCELKAGTTSSRVFVNSSRQTRDTKKYTLKTVKSTKRDSGKNNQKISVFVSRLDPTTKPRDVAMYLKHVHGKHFKVEQLRNKFPGYASFKVNVTSKDQLQPLLNKNNWDSGVFVKEFNVKNNY